MIKQTNKQKVKARHPKAYAFKRTAGEWNGSFDIISEPNHVVSVILSSSYKSFHAAWKEVAEKLK